MIGGHDRAAGERTSRWGIALLVAVTLALQGVSWRILEGYQVADSVEFVENAQALVRGHEVLDSQAIRSAFFPLLLSPPLLLADLLGVEDQRPLFWLMRLLQMGIGVGVVLAAARLARTVAGETAGLLAGWTVAVNPVFLQYTVSPLTDVMAALLVTLGLVALADPQRSRRGLWGGVFLGLAVMVSYKTLAMAAAAVAVLMAAGRWRGRRTWLEALGGLGACALAQVLLDWATYGSPGHSLFIYVGANFGPLAGKLCYVPAGWLEGALPAVSDALKRAAVWLYSLNELLGEVESPATDPIRGKYPWHWYASSLHEWVVPSLLVGTAAGAWSALRGKAAGRARNVPTRSLGARAEGDPGSSSFLSRRVRSTRRSSPPRAGRTTGCCWSSCPPSRGARGLDSHCCEALLEGGARAAVGGACSRSRASSPGPGPTGSTSCWPATRASSRGTGTPWPGSRSRTCPTRSSGSQAPTTGRSSCVRHPA